ncbi:MAG: phosphoribosylformylglycinamidine cyclo-ligase [Candidatus Hydrogenedentota bacterium]
MTTVTYEDAGVSIDRGDDVVRRIASFIPGIGDFGGRFPLDTSGCEKPILVAGADGVGTKIRVSLPAGKPESLGIDLVAMNVNDILCSGAKPLFFLDYIASSHLDPELIERLVRGMNDGCRQAGCRLLGGETAELPGFYAPGECDLAGFAVGIVDEKNILGPERVRENDVLLGLESTGLHSNGFSLARKILCPDDRAIDRDLAERLSVPTRIYVNSILALMNRVEIHAIAHITGGGIPGNVIRAVPEGLGVIIDERAWPEPGIFREIASRGNVPIEEMRGTFNMGIGMIVLLPESEVASAKEILSTRGETTHVIGNVTRNPGVIYK